MLKRLKPYKNASPMETVHLIRRILFDNDIFVIETSQKIEPLTGVCSCRIILGDAELRDLNIGSNGKGMNARFALASAYAEFMERLQNGALLWKVIGIPQRLPKEKTIDKEKYWEAVSNIFKITYGNKDYLKVINQLKTGSIDYNVIEFSEYLSNEKLLFPVKMLNRMTGSNGMASGNTKIEAIIQGLSEIFERYATQEVFLHKTDLPIIKEDYFEGTDVLDRLHQLCKKGLRFRILDCSLGKGLPVIGLLLERNNRYHIHFGADPSPITALERCLTETFQGRDIDLLPLYPVLSESVDENTLFNNEVRQYTDSTGQVPYWVVDSCASEFNGFVHEITVSDEDDMEYYVRILSDLGLKLYVCDMETLGFPTVRLFVPGITENHCPTQDYVVKQLVPVTISNYMNRLPLLNDEEYKTLAGNVKSWLDEKYGDTKACDICGENYTDLKCSMAPGRFAYHKWEGPLLIAAILCRGGIEKLGMEVLQFYTEKNNLSRESSEYLRVRLKSHKLIFTKTEWPCCPNCSECSAKELCCKCQVDDLNDKLEEILLM